MKKSSVYLSIVVIVALVIALIIIGYSTITQNDIAAPQTTIQKTTRSSEKSALQITEEDSQQLEPLPSNTKKAIDSEIDNIESEMDSLSDVNLDDLSDIESSF